MWSFENPQAVVLAQLVVEALLVVLVGLLLWRQPRVPRESPKAGEGVMAATENLLRRLEEKRQALETAVDSVNVREPAAVQRPDSGQREVPAGRKDPLERATTLAARGLTSSQIARELGVPRAEVEMFLSLREGIGRRA
jgi:hypothetical protein